MSKIYVAGSSKEIARVRFAMNAIRSMPQHELTYDWTIQVEAFGAGRESELSTGEKVRIAEEEYNAVVGAGILLYLVPSVLSEGSATEFGIALGAGLEILVSGTKEAIDARLFPHAFGWNFVGASDDEVIDWLRGQP